MKKIYFILLISLSFLFSLCSFSQSTYSDVAGIFYARCTNCHHANQHAPSLMSYTDVLNLSSSIENKLQANLMPPWSPDTSYSRFAHERIITQAEKAAILNWINTGALAGDTSLAPPQPSYSIYQLNGTPDLVLSTGNISSNASSTDSYMCIAIPTGLSQSRILRAYEIVPGNASIVHHVLVSVDTMGTTTSDLSGGCFTIPGDFGVGGYAPGAAPTVFPGQAPLKAGMVIKANSKIDLQIHYPPGTSGEMDNTQIRMYFYPIGATGIRTVYNTVPLQNWSLSIPANTTRTFTAHYPASGGTGYPISVFAAFPHSHKVCTKLVNYAYLGTDTIPLIRMNNWDFNWQGYYTFKNLIKIPAGYKLFSSHFYDNTSSNPFNPHTPPQAVFAGTGTNDEMLFDAFQWFVYQPGDEIIDIDALLSVDTLLTASIQDIKQQQNQFNCFIFPNPAKTTITLLFPKKSDYSIKLIALTGQQLFEKTIVDEEASIDTSMLSDGFYFVEISNLNTKEKLIKKIVIAH